LGESFVSSPAQLSYEELATKNVPVVRVREGGKFFHFVQRADLKSAESKRAARALCGATAAVAWKFGSGSRACQTCSSLAGKSVVMPAPVLPDVHVLPTTHEKAWSGPPALFESKYAGQCRACGHGYRVGDKIYWKRGEGSRHQTCGPHDTSA
jgi:hypothetical protein